MTEAEKSDTPAARAEAYRPEHRAAWNAFVRESKNGTFLFDRAYMEYHADRFADQSLLIFDRRDRLVALLPASHKEGVVTSHGGLTYGGFVTDASMTLPVMLETIEAALLHLKAAGHQKLVYRPVPAPYHRVAANEDLVAMFLLDAPITRRNALAVVDQRARLPIQERRRRGAKKAAAAGVTVRFEADLEAYWTLLTEVLRDTHGSKPVHTIDEIRQLQAAFPENIKLVGAFKDAGLVAGVLIFESAQVARSQYIAAGPTGKALGALDVVFSTLLNELYLAKPFFDFGTSDLSGGRVIQRGLIEQKEGFGARVMVQDQYEIDLQAWTPGKALGALQ